MSIPRFCLCAAATALVAASEATSLHADEPCRPDQFQKLIPTQATEGDAIGGAIDIDGHWAVIGATGDDVGAINTGSAFIYFFNGTEWQQEARIAAPVAGNSARFGNAVAIDDDVIVVGADTQAGTGQAFVFRRDGMDWNFEQMLTGSGVQNLQRFGFAVDVCGDTIMVSSPFVGGTGGVFVYEFDGLMWNEVDLLESSDIQAGDQFGFSFALCERTLVVGSPLDDGPRDGGAAYIFKFGSGTWSETAKIESDDIAQGDLFGSSAAIQDDVVLIGATGDSTARGAVYVFKRGSNWSNWDQIAKLVASDRDPSDEFGYRVAISDNWIIVGAPERPVPLRTGSAYFFRNDGNDVWTFWRRVRADDRKSFDQFGSAVGIAGDLALIGSPNSDRAQGTTGGVGSAYAFNLACPAEIRTLRVRDGDNVNGDIPRLRKTDDRHLIVQSVIVGAKNRVKVDFICNSDVLSDRDELDVVIESSNDQPGVTANVFVKRWSNGRFSRVATYEPGDEDAVMRIDNLNANRYVKGSGKIIIRIVHTSPNPFETAIDLLQANVR